MSFLMPGFCSNHFIEIDEASDGTKYLVIHSGSRNLGKQVAEYYQQLAIDLNHGREEYFAKRDQIIEEYKAAGRKSEIQSVLKSLKWEKKDADVPDDLCYLYGKYLDDYLHDVVICQRFAREISNIRHKCALVQRKDSGLQIRKNYNAYYRRNFERYDLAVMQSPPIEGRT